MDINRYYQDYNHYIQTELFIPNTNFLNSVVNTIKPNQFNLRDFIKKAKLENPILNYSEELYKNLVLDNLLDIMKSKSVIDFKILNNFNKDLMK